MSTNMIETKAISTYAGEMVYPVAYSTLTYAIDIGLWKWVDSIKYKSHSQHLSKLLGFDHQRFALNTHNESEAHINFDININFSRFTSRGYIDQLIELSRLCLGIGCEFYLYDDYWMSYKFTCRWENAIDFKETSALQNQISMNLKSYEIAVIS